MTKQKKILLIIGVIVFCTAVLCINYCGNSQDDDEGSSLPENISESIPDDEQPVSEPVLDADVDVDEELVYGPFPGPLPEPEPEPEPEPAYPGPDVELFPWDGTVEHLFTHEVIVWPEYAFRPGPMQKNYDDNMITALEFERILESLHRNGFILVDINDVWSEFTNSDGLQRMRRNTLMLPEGKKPLIFSFDDINFYEYMIGDGFMSRLIIGEDGEIWETGTDPGGREIVTQGNTVVTIVDQFVRENPDFSLHGAKGTLALTGYEGILGYRTHTDRNDTSQAANLRRMQEIAMVRPVIEKLKQTGWNFASHTFGHIRLDTSSFDRVRGDAERWMDEVGSLVGETQVLIYSFGGRLDGDDVRNTGPAFRFYVDLGFRLFASVGREPYTQIKNDIPAVIMDRMNIDGMTLRNRRERFLRFYDAMEILDDRRPDFGNTW